MEAITETVNIKHFYLNVEPHASFRTTKGGKRILKGEITMRMNAYITTDKLQVLKSGDDVGINGIVFKHIIKYEQSVFRNMNNYEKKQLVIDTTKPLQIIFLGRMLGESSY